MSQGCEVKRIQVNSAQAALDLAQQARDGARSDYNTCLGPAATGDAAVADAQPTLDRLQKEAGELSTMHEITLQMLQRESETLGAVKGLGDIAEDRSADLQKEIDELKATIRTEKRKFLDASPSVSPAVGGLYFTTSPDNQTLIAFLSCFGAFLLFVSLLIVLNMIPIDYFVNMTQDDRIKLVGILWVVAIVATYAGLYVFT